MVHYLSLAEFAERAGLSANTIKGYLRKGIGPAPDATIGSHRGWLPETIDAWIKLRRIQVGPTGHPNRRGKRNGPALSPGHRATSSANRTPHTTP